MNAYLNYLIFLTFLGAVVPGKAQEYGRGSKAKATAATTDDLRDSAERVGGRRGTINPWHFGPYGRHPDEDGSFTRV